MFLFFSLKAENQSSIKTPEVPGTTQLPDASSKTTASPSASLTTPKSISHLQGAPENGNDQPQSDKESVTLLTVKTISHESGLIFSFQDPRMERRES
ncbi:hypothetical protein U0070_025402 [Myodes glareolus]|uniref:Uncharacterized protein n=1 Tax=Myodes glareolus TaxID=447135 RepID=A0AAW0IZ56_MYOGA